jgi:hypothetical protein
MERLQAMKKGVTGREGGFEVTIESQRVEYH